MTQDQLNHPAIRTAVQTCEACPDQWEGELADGRAFYFRYRGGIASLAIGADRDSVAGVCRPGDRPDVALALFQHGDGLSGMFANDQERSEVFRRLFMLVPPAGTNDRADPPEEAWHVGCTGCWRTIWH